MNQRPLVSIIIPCYNQAVHVAASIESVLAQSYRLIEVIAVNDGSTDGSADRIRHFGSEVQLIDLGVNHGVCTALNKAFSQARGAYLIRLDADDLLRREAVEELSGVLRDNPDVDFVYYPGEYFGAEQGLQETFEFDVERLKQRNYVNSSAMMRRRVFETTGGYDEHLNRLLWEDWEFWINAAAHGFKGKLLNKPLLLYRRYGESGSRDQAVRRKQKKAMRYIRLKHWRFLGLKFWLRKALEKLRNPVL
jgi:glycosyltransferase involved in cell wall biosynthesis